ncbi:fibronectin type III domain-containing protein, partial [bacterium]|nr:fibronectin type III domain-containing protein [bacterium]
STDGGSTFTAVSPAATTSPISITGLSNGTSYNVQIRAVNAAGDGTATGSTAATPRTTPGAPTGLSVTPGNGQLTASFTAPASNGGSTITNYEYSTNGGSNFTAVSPASTSTSIVIPSLSNGTSYNVQVRAVNAAGSGSATASVAATPRTTPGAPSITSITPGNGQLSVAFSAPASNGGASITNYRYSLDNGALVSVGSTSSPFTISGLNNDQSYAVRLYAVNSAGDSAASTAVNGTPTAPASPTVTVSGLSGALTTTYGTASAERTFTVSGSTLSGNLTVTAPTGLEVSSTSGGTFTDSLLLTASSGSVANTTVYVRLKASALVAGTYNNVSITITGGGDDKSVSTATGNSVTAKALNVSGASATSRDYDGTTAIAVTGGSLTTGSGAGQVLTEDAANVTLGGSPSGTVASKNVGTSKAVTVTGYSLSGSAAGNYSVTQPTGLSADITA